MAALKSTSLDSIEFTQDGKTHRRLYYQTNTDKCIRESSFDSENGCFVRGNGIVVGKDIAKAKSPIAVTRWNTDNITHIRLYFINGSNIIQEIIGEHSNNETTWKAISSLIDGDEPKVAENSKLAIARPDQDGQTLRVYYQEKGDGNKQALREIKYSKGRRGVKWEVQTPSIPGAVSGTSLSAVSAKPSGDVRLYYQGLSGIILESFWNARNGQWNDRAKELHRNFILAPSAPIAAICWYPDNGENKTDANLRLRVYTILKSKSTTISELSFQDGSWDSDTAELGDPAPLYTPQYQVYTAIGAARNTKAENNYPISLFYQSRENAIDFKVMPAEYDDQSKLNAESVFNAGLPGIPTSL